MNKKIASSITLYVPHKMREAIDAHTPKNGIAYFIRSAIAEKLLRDFGVEVESNVRHGQRTDIADNPERLAALQAQAAKMRERRWKK